MTGLTVTIHEKDGRRTQRVLTVAEVLLAGYTGRDRASVVEHIRELEQLGIAAPPRVPMVYVVSPELVTTDDRIEVRVPETSGEVEFYLLPTADGLLVGVGSDHTDRQHEAIDVAESKTLCAKVLSRGVWRYADVQDHWDQIEIRAWTTDPQGKRLYQAGCLSAFMGVDDLLAEVRAAGHPDLAGRLIFGGTIPALGGLSYGERFETELQDPLLDRVLTCGYDIVVR